MKKLASLFVIIVLFIFGCTQSGKQPNQLLSKNSLLTQLFTIDINKDTILSTANGAFISIPKGALSSTGNSSVQLQIKEAYTIEQIIMAGLTTQNNNKPMSSGGMIYISAVGEQSIQITKAISIKIPTSFIDKNMSVFRGDSDKNGNINWIRRDSLSSNTQVAAFEEGRKLFMNNCASCHAIGKESTGPDLAHILKRTPDKKLLYDYTRNNQKVMREGDRYYNLLYCMYYRRTRALMNLFPALTDQDLDKLYGYIENESAVLNLPSIKDERACVDSCETYSGIKNKLTAQKTKLSQEKVDMIIKQIINQPVVASPIPVTNVQTSFPSNNIKQVTPDNNQSLFYQFNIQAFGWYNIDILLDEKYGSVESQLMVRIRGQYKQNFSIYLVIPQARIFTEGGKLEDKEDEYGFYKSDGKINLPQNIKAYILSMGEVQGQLIFSKREFTTSKNQELDMSLSVVTKEFFHSELNNLKLPEISFSVKDTKNADTLRKIIQQLTDVEKIKPKNCDCNCGEEARPVAFSLDKDTSAAPHQY